MINGERMSNLRFADNIVLFANDDQQLEQMIVSLNEEGKQGRERRWHKD